MTEGEVGDQDHCLGSDGDGSDGSDDESNLVRLFCGLQRGCGLARRKQVTNCFSHFPGAVAVGFMLDDGF